MSINVEDYEHIEGIGPDSGIKVFVLFISLCVYFIFNYYFSKVNYILIIKKIQYIFKILISTNHL